MRATRNVRRTLTAGTFWLLFVLGGAAHAASPPITTQAAAANAAFLAYAPPPAGGARALCLVDSGVNPTPDTSPGLVSATAIDGGDGADADPLLHGTIDAAIAGGAGYGVLGAWPLLKIVSVRATEGARPGQQPTYQFDDYTRGILACVRPFAGVQVAAIAVPLSSVIPPTPDQTEEFENAVSVARTAGIAIVAAAGNAPGAIQLPASQPGILPVGAGDSSNAICPFSASTGLTFFAPGCGLDQIDTKGETFCCGNGTSQASAFAGGVLVAMRSYDPSITAAKAIDLLVSSSRHGHLDAAAAFRAGGLDAIVDAGTSAIPKPPSAAAPAQTGVPRRVPRPSVKSATWRRGILQIRLNRVANGARLHAKVVFARGKAVFLSTTRVRLRARTRPPRKVVLHQSRNGARSATVSVRVVRSRR